MSVMKSKTVSILSLLAFVLLVTTNLNASAKENKLETKVLISIQKNILLPDSQQAVIEAKKLSQLLITLGQQPEQKNLLKTQAQFIQLMKAWKRVETLYSAGNIDVDMLDTTRYIDVYHSGKENLTKQLRRALTSSKKIKRALFKNSTKSITALEYMLFFSKKNELLQFPEEGSSRRIKLAQHINHSLTQHLKDISQFYIDEAKNKNRFVSQGKKSVEDLVNVLIDSSYKLLTWRIAEPGGFSDKYTGKPSTKHLEYNLSRSSFYATQSILQSFKDVLNAKDFLELGDLGIAQGVTEKINSVQRNIDKAIDKNNLIIKNLEKNKSNLSKTLLSPEYKDLHRALVRLHNSFYILLIDSLDLKAKIIEADGD